MSQEITSGLRKIASVTPPSKSRAWQTSVHPRLPMLATCNSDKVVNIYSMSNFTQLSSITGGHKRSIRSIAWKPNVSDESILATGSFDASVGIWRRDDDRGLDVSTPMAATIGMETDFTRNGSAENDEHEEDEEWRFALVLDGHDSEVKSVAWSAGGNLLATCARDKSVWVWEEVGEDDYETIAVLQEHDGDVKCVAWHPEEELLASGSYDDDVRLWREDVDDWDCVSLLRGHSSTVWTVEFEGLRPHLNSSTHGQLSSSQQEWISRREAAGPRLITCSDDKTIRIWRRVPKESKAQNTMSIIRSGSIEETWVEEARLPAAHALAIYSVAWSRETGRVVSTGADGKIVVYEERWADEKADEQSEADAAGQEEESDGSKEGNYELKSKLNALTSWHVVAECPSAHGVYEINHVAWSRRTDKGKTYDSEEMVVSTGDDGCVNLWSII